MIQALILTALLQAPAHPNLIVNGDFEQGNKGFLTDYIFSSNLGPDGNYNIGANPHDHHPGAASFGDHTIGSGKMLIVNGNAGVDQTVWEETIRVDRRRSYAFSGWVASWSTLNGSPDPSPARLLIYANGKKLGPVFHVSDLFGLWNQFSFDWNSDRNRSVVLRIVDHNTDTVGNDFALDDLSFAQRVPIGT